MRSTKGENEKTRKEEKRVCISHFALSREHGWHLELLYHWRWWEAAESSIFDVGVNRRSSLLVPAEIYKAYNAFIGFWNQIWQPIFKENRLLLACGATRLLPKFGREEWQIDGVLGKPRSYRLLLKDLSSMSTRSLDSNNSRQTERNAGGKVDSLLSRGADIQARWLRCRSLA